jgi:hypothetical protein
MTSRSLLGVLNARVDGLGMHQIFYELNIIFWGRGMKGVLFEISSV